MKCSVQRTLRVMAAEVGVNNEERLCITQHEQREYDACNWENPDFPGDGG